jgi:hypothetical protein
MLFDFFKAGVLGLNALAILSEERVLRPWNLARIDTRVHGKYRSEFKELLAEQLYTARFVSTYILVPLNLLVIGLIGLSVLIG